MPRGLQRAYLDPKSSSSSLGIFRRVSHALNLPKCLDPIAKTQQARAASDVAGD